MKLRLSNPKQLLKIGEWVLIFGIIVFSLAAKLNGLGKVSFDFDEIYSVKFSLWNNYWSFMTASAYDPGNPPFYFIILKFWQSLLGTSEAKLRFLSVFFNFLAITIFSLQAKKHLKPAAAITAVFLFAGSGLLFFYSRYVRTYSLIVFLTLSVFPLLLNLLAKPKISILQTVTLYLLCLLGFYSHYSFVIF